MMNPFHYPISDDELYFQIPSANDDNNYYSLPIQQAAAAAAEEDNNQILQFDPMTMMDGSSVPPRTNQKGKDQLTTAAEEDYNHHQKDQNENKKWMHREIEKQRRQEMARLCTTFRSLLPLEYIKGKRSTSDQMHEGVNYIKDLQEKVQQLQAKRDELMKLCDLRHAVGSDETGKSFNHQIPTFVIVEPFCGGIQIKCSYSFRNDIDAFPLSRVLDIVLKEGLHFLNSTSTNTHHHSRVIHTIRSEDPYMRTETYYTELQRKLAQAISSSST